MKEFAQPFWTGRLIPRLPFKISLVMPFDPTSCSRILGGQAAPGKEKIQHFAR